MDVIIGLGVQECARLGGYSFAKGTLILAKDTFPGQSDIDQRPQISECD